MKKNVFILILLGIIFYNSYNQFNLNYHYLINGVLNIYYTNIDLIFVPFFILFLIIIFYFKKIKDFINQNFKFLSLLLFIVNLIGLYINNFSSITLIIELRTFLFIIFIETLFWFLEDFKKLQKNKNIIRFYLFFILVFTQFLSFKLGFFLEHPELFKGTVIDLVDNNNFIFIFYNPVLPLLNLSLLQLILIILFGGFICYLRNYIKKELNKKEMYYLVGIILIGLLYNIFLGQHNLLETDYHQVGYSNSAGEINFLSKIENINPQYYGIGFHDFLNLFSRFTIGNNWNLYYTYIVNTLLNTFNIFVIFILSLSLWKKKTIAYFNSIFYLSSIPILIYLTGDTSYILATTILMFLVFFLKKFYDSNYLKFEYFYLAILSIIFLYYTHHQFILLPLIIVLYFILFFRKNIYKLFDNLKKIFFYIFAILFLIPVIYIKQIDSYLDNGLKGKYNISVVLDNLFSFDYINKILFTKINGFLTLDHNSIIILLFLLPGILLSLFLKNGFRIVLFLFGLHYLIFFPHYYSFPSGLFSGLLDVNIYLNYFNSWLTDYYVKGSTTLFIYVLFLGITPYFILKYVKNNKIKNGITLFFVSLILIIPFFNYNKLKLNFNQQNNYNFVNKVVDKVKKLDKVKIYGEDGGHHGYNIGFELNGINISSNFKNIDWSKNNYYYLGSYCYEYHKNGVTGGVQKLGEKCFIFTAKNIKFIPVIEEEFDCIPYDIEEVCLQNKMKLGLYKMEKINNK